MIAAFFSFSCKTTKLDGAGNKVPTKNTIHMNRVHPNGFFAGGKYILPYPTKIVNK